MGVKISQLPEVLSANSNDYLVINHEGATSQIMVETLMDSYLSSAGFITESDLADYLSSNLDGYLSEYVTGSDLDPELPINISFSYHPSTPKNEPATAQKEKRKLPTE